MMIMLSEELAVVHNTTPRGAGAVLVRLVQY
jgi:hypothetical protein